ncbi:MAG: hypothetical protein JW795_04180, partial [Chitinivibrionales bacterium]|nr:hypothetical protein [Chitinivibrionales bacterium]
MHSLKEKCLKLHKRLNGCTIEYDCRRYDSLVSKIKQKQACISTLSDSQLKEVSAALMKRCAGVDSGHTEIVTAFAVVAEAIIRRLSLTPFDVQLAGALALHEGKIVEMQTGEGKTIMAVFAAYAHALCGKGVHILTFNDYLCRRDALWMGPVYEFLGLRVGYVQEGMNRQQRKDAYGCDITYCTAKEAGFDYLRDCLCMDSRQRVLRPFHSCIIDEADSILIDEARIPL